MRGAAASMGAFGAWTTEHLVDAFGNLTVRTERAKEDRRAGSQKGGMALSELLRRVARSRFGAPAIASLHGNEWSGFLALRAPDESKPQLFTLIADAPYQPAGRGNFGQAIGADSASLVHATRQWIRRNA